MQNRRKVRKVALPDRGDDVEPGQAEGGPSVKQIVVHLPGPVAREQVHLEVAAIRQLRFCNGRELESMLRYLGVVAGAEGDMTPEGEGLLALVKVRSKQAPCNGSYISH